MKNRTPMTSFREMQRFRTWPIQAVLATAAAFVGWGFYRQAILGKPWGDRPGPTWILIAALALLGFLLFALRKMELTTEVGDEGICLRFFALYPRTKRIPYAQIRSAEARTYRALADYLGWGIRWGADGTCWTVRGGRGVFLRLADGAGFLLGSQQADELAAAIRQRMPA